MVANEVGENPEVTNAAENVQAQSTAVAFYGQTGNNNDFPVLKAFQEYIDAEQAKARKRMVGLAAFFIVLLVVVVVTFTLIMTTFISRNQELSDKLLDIALRDRNPIPQPVVTVQQPPPQPIIPSQASHESVLKPVLEQIEKLTSVMSAKTQQQSAQPLLTTPSPVPVQSIALPLPSAESAETIKLREELRRQQEELKAEKEKLKKSIRQAEIEKHRRRLYPEYYAQEEAKKLENERLEAEQKRAPAPLPVAPDLKLIPKKDPPQPLPKQPSSPSVAPRQEQVSRESSTSNQKSTPISKEVNLKNIKPINYFDGEEDDEELKEMLQKVKMKPAEASRPPQKLQKASIHEAKPKLRESKQQPGKKLHPTFPSQTPKVEPPNPTNPIAPLATKESAVKTETISVGQSSENSIPWLIEVSGGN